MKHKLDPQKLPSVQYIHIHLKCKLHFITGIYTQVFNLVLVYNYIYYLESKSV